MPVGCI
ncbi:hypothetical protein CGLO_07658 [Colletotrichum gloeosporioides Cg-14]|nr:hypothetical protein CGLO_07658 [Colletotrichum gloeosporioides Cg-14]